LERLNRKRHTTRLCFVCSRNLPGVVQHICGSGGRTKPTWAHGSDGLNSFQLTFSYWHFNNDGFWCKAIIGANLILCAIFICNFCLHVALCYSVTEFTWSHWSLGSSRNPLTILHNGVDGLAYRN
jgi:hypothetical protein